MSLRMRKPTISVSDQVRHKLACTVTEAGYMSSETKGADQLCSDCTADLRLLFSHEQIVDYTPGIYADGYIVFAFPFVRSYVR